METTAVPAEVAPPRRCENCGAELLGEHCYACGQPTRGLVRHFSSIVGDFLDSVFDFDSRILRTIGPLMFRPGRLSNEYFAGHRVRYVSPVRLFVFLCIAAFFALQLTVDIDFQGDGESDIERAGSVEQVEKLRDQAVAGLREARDGFADGPGADGARAGMDAAIASIEEGARRRIAELEREAAARGSRPTGAALTDGFEAAPAARSEHVAGGSDERETASGKGGALGSVRTRVSSVQFNDEPWDPETNPIEIGWASEGINAWLNQLAGRAQSNVERIRAEPRLLVEAFMDALPQTLFVLLPVFALLLKVFYLFKRRLYMEHLIVALHSHAFLCLAILCLVGLGELRDATEGVALVHTGLGWIELVLALWMPIYLLLMQRRVYRQNWFLTLLKYCVLGTCYLVLLSVGAAFNLALSVVAM